MVTANGQHNQSYIYWLWFLVGAMGRPRLVGKELYQHNMQCNITWMNKTT
jgi:hypothetical protein